jgi:hypothetical protein
MISLQMTEAKAKKLEEVEGLALDVIKGALDDTLAADDEKVKVAVKTMSVVAKNRQTLTHRVAIDFGMATSIASDKEMKKYIENTQPHIRKALTGKTS